jgi:hypothetical protein
MNNEPLNDDVLLDRLVDGELTSTERRRLLESLDGRPEGWRRCALAFLEAQSWRDELGQVARTPAPKGEESTTPPSKLSNGKSRWIGGVQFFALAASLLMAFGLGWMQRERAVKLANRAQATNEQVAKVTPQGAIVNPTGAKPGNALTLFVRDEAGKMQPVRVPLVDAGTLDQQLGLQFQPGLTDELRDQLKGKGYAVQSKQQYAPLWLENGRPMVVPVEDTKIVPVSNENVY